VTFRPIREVISARPMAAENRYDGVSSRPRVVPLLATLLVAIFVLSFAARQSAAALLNDGDFVFAGSVGDPTAGASVVNSETDPVTTRTFDANVTSTVYANATNNPFTLSVPGALTFVYSITVTGPIGAEVDRLNISSFAAALTDVGYNTTNGGTVLPTFLERDLSGSTDTVSFIFPDGSSPYGAILGPTLTNPTGDTSALLVINTNSTSYSPTFAFLQDGSNGITPSYAVFAPMFATPEPASIVLMLLGMMGMLVKSRSYRSKKIATSDVV
jgi:PEP-CTERM motif